MFVDHLFNHWYALTVSIPWGIALLHAVILVVTMTTEEEAEGEGMIVGAEGICMGMDAEEEGEEGEFLGEEFKGGGLKDRVAAQLLEVVFKEAVPLPVVILVVWEEGEFKVRTIMPPFRLLSTLLSLTSNSIF